MTELKCKAENCSYNDHELCKKGDIHVGGKHACVSNETNCDSFTEKCNCEFSESLTPDAKATIACEAEKCTYNKNEKCTAGHVDIQGKNADIPSETTCGTFREK